MLIGCRQTIAAKVHSHINGRMFVEGPKNWLNFYKFAPKGVFLLAQFLDFIIHIVYTQVFNNIKC